MKNTSKKNQTKPLEDVNKIKPNDLNRLSNTLKKATSNNIAIAPRGQSKEIQKLKAAIELMNFKEDENWKISAMLSAPEELNLGVKKLFGDEISMMGPKTYL
jgi:hypothetical protein